MDAISHSFPLRQGLSEEALLAILRVLLHGKRSSPKSAYDAVPKSSGRSLIIAAGRRARKLSRQADRWT